LEVDFRNDVKGCIRRHIEYRGSLKSSFRIGLALGRIIAESPARRRRAASLRIIPVRSAVAGEGSDVVIEAAAETFAGHGIPVQPTGRIGVDNVAFGAFPISVDGADGVLEYRHPRPVILCMGGGAGRGVRRDNAAGAIGEGAI